MPTTARVCITRLASQRSRTGPVEVEEQARHAQPLLDQVQAARAYVRRDAIEDAAQTVRQGDLLEVTRRVGRADLVLHSSRCAALGGDRGQEDEIDLVASDVRHEVPLSEL